MEKEAKTLSNYFRTDCPLTFHNITEIHPFWDRDLLWLQRSERWQHPMLCWLAASLQIAHRRGLIIASPEIQFAREEGWRGDMAFCISLLPESSGNSCMDCFKWIWKAFLSLSFFSWNLLPYVISFYAYPYVLWFTPWGKKSFNCQRSPETLFSIAFYKHREVGLTWHHQPSLFLEG